jgi:RNA polymerase sigma-70 factor (sigma-E family)
MADDSFDEFTRAQIASLTRYAIALTGDRHAADDLVQETLVRLLGAWKRIRKDGNPAAYATTVMFRAHISLWRKRQRLPRSVELIGEPSAGHDPYPSVDSRLSLDRRLQTLTRMQRAVIVATYLDDHSDAEIAHMIGRSTATVRSLRHRGLKALRIDMTAESDREVAGGDARIAAT